METVALLHIDPPAHLLMQRTWCGSIREFLRGVRRCASLVYDEPGKKNGRADLLGITSETRGYASLVMPSNSTEKAIAFFDKLAHI
jgi:hypothetical protein